MPKPAPAKNPLRLVVMISGHGSNLQAILDAIGRGDLTADVVAVVSDKPTAFGLQRARQRKIPARAAAPSDYPNRTAWQTALAELVDSFSPDLVLLAGFMRILDDAFVARFAGRMLNVHPSLLPALRGLHTHRRALADKLSHHGASVHFVTPELDGGPVILQARVAILPDHDEATLAARVRVAEHVIYPRVLQWFANGRVKLYDNHVFLDGERLAAPPVIDFE